MAAAGGRKGRGLCLPPSGAQAEAQAWQRIGKRVLAQHPLVTHRTPFPPSMPSVGGSGSGKLSNLPPPMRSWVRPATSLPPSTRSWAGSDCLPNCYAAHWASTSRCADWKIFRPAFAYATLGLPLTSCLRLASLACLQCPASAYAVLGHWFPLGEGGKLIFGNYF